MDMTDEQCAKARLVRDILDVQAFSDPFLPFDFTDAIGAIMDGVEKLAKPDEMGQRFNAAWSAYARIHANEYQSAVVQALGDDKALWEQVRGHPNGCDATSEILDRIQAVHGDITPGMEVDGIDVSDILVDHQIC